MLERPGSLLTHIDEAHATAPLLEQLNAQHQVLLEQERWVQAGPWEPERIEQEPDGREIAQASWHLIPGDQLPTGRLCVSVEQKGRIVWLLHTGHATQQLCDEINAVLRRIVGDGLWRQRWPGRA